MPHLLAPLGFEHVDSDVYGALLAVRRSEIGPLAGELNLDDVAVAKSLELLISHGLVNRLLCEASVYLAVSPDVALPGLIQRRRSDLSQLLVAADALAADLRHVVDCDLSVAEMVRGEEAVIDAITTIQGEAYEEVLMVDAPPYAGATASPNDAEFVKLAQGVAYRVVYHPAALASEVSTDHMRRCVAAGEQARLHADAGPKLLVADRRIAIVVASADDPDPMCRLLVRPSALMDMVLAHFESLWTRAAPIGADVDESSQVEIGERDRQLLSMLAAGMQDRAIARTLGVTERTVGRRLSQIMERLDADTRFRAGVRAAQQGWI